MFYRNTEITEKTEITLSKVIKTMSDISIVMTLSTLPTKRCGLYSLTTQRTLGTDASGHLCYWFYDGNNDRCLNGSTVLSGTDVKVGVVHSRKGVRLYVNGVLDAFCEAPLWSENVNTSYIGTHGLAPSDLEMDGTIEGVLLTDYAMTDEEMSVASWDSEFCVVKNHLFYVPSNSTLHVGDDIASSLDEGSVYVLEDMGSLVLSNEEKLPCWYIGEYNATTQDITLNISDKRGGGTYNRMEVDHLTVHEIEVANTGHVVEAEGEEDVYPYLAINESNNAIFTNPHIDTMKVEYHCTANVVPNPNTITVWGSSYDDTFPYIYAKYTITYKDGASGTIITVVRDPSHQQYMVRTVTCYVESTSSTYTWPKDPTTFASGTTLSFYSRNAHAGKYQFTRQWTWFGIDWSASSHSDRPNASVVTGFTSGHWVSGSETALFVVDDDYLRNIMVVEDVVSQSVKDYATSHSQPVSSYMGKKSLPSDLSSGYALKDSTGSLQAKDCYLDEIHADGFTTETFGWNGTAGWGWNESHISDWKSIEDFLRSDYNLVFNRDMSADIEIKPLEKDFIKYCFNNEISDTELWGNTYTPTINYDASGYVVCKSLLAIDGNPTYSVSEGARSSNLRNFVHDVCTAGDSFIERVNNNASTGDKGAICNIYFEFVGKDRNRYQLYSILPTSSTHLYQNSSFKMEQYEYNMWASFYNVGLITNGNETHTYDRVLMRVDSYLGWTLSDLYLCFFDSGSSTPSLRLTVDKITLLPAYLTLNGQERWTGVMVATDETKIDEDGVEHNVYKPIYIQNWWDICMDIINETIGMYKKNPVELITQAKYSYISSIPYTTFKNSFPTDMVVRTWNKRGRILARSVVPYPKTDEGVKYYGATLGRNDAIWDSLYVKGITDGWKMMCSPYYGAKSSSIATIYFFDNYKMVIGRGTDNECEFLLDYPFINSISYILLTNGTVTAKEAGRIVITKPSEASEVNFIAIGEEQT